MIHVMPRAAPASAAERGAEPAADSERPAVAAAEPGADAVSKPHSHHDSDKHSNCTT